MADPYELLGVGRTATADEIRKAYRTLAKKNHPDLHPGDKAAEARFKDIASAYAIVGEETQRALFDAGKIDGSGAELHQRSERRSYRQHAEARPGFKYQPERSGASGDEDDLLAALFRQHARTDVRGADATSVLAVAFIDAINGTKTRVVMTDGRMLDITIPAGVKEDQILRLRRQGPPGRGLGEPGDVLVQIHVKPHPVFSRDGDNIHSTLPVTSGEAMAGAKVAVATVSGMVNLTVPKGSNAGTKLRLRGKGVPNSDAPGDHIVDLLVVLPDQPDDAFVQSIVDWEAKHPYDPRKKQGAAS